MDEVKVFIIGDRDDSNIREDLDAVYAWKKEMADKIVITNIIKERLYAFREGPCSITIYYHDKQATKLREQEIAPHLNSVFNKKENLED